MPANYFMEVPDQTALRNIRSLPSKSHVEFKEDLSLILKPHISVLKPIARACNASSLSVGHALKISE